MSGYDVIYDDVLHGTTWQFAMNSISRVRSLDPASMQLPSCKRSASAQVDSNHGNHSREK